MLHYIISSNKINKNYRKAFALNFFHSCSIYVLSRFDLRCTVPNLEQEKFSIKKYYENYLYSPKAGFFIKYNKATE